MLAPVGLTVEAPFPNRVGIVTRLPTAKTVREVGMNVCQIVGQVADERVGVFSIVGVEYPGVVAAVPKTSADGPIEPLLTCPPLLVQVWGDKRLRFRRRILRFGPQAG